NAHRVLAYRTAASRIENLAESLEEIAKIGDLKQIPGIGESIAQKIQDILSTGTTPTYDELKAEFPEGLIDVIAVPGIGPKIAKLLYEKLGVSSLQDLEQAARDHRIRNVSGIGPKTESKILRAIRIIHRQGERMLLGTALPFAEDLMTRLKEDAPVEQISEAGSLRRRQETVGDIDIVVGTNNPNAVIHAFTHLPQVHEVIEEGASMSSVLTRTGFRMDLRVALMDNYGAMLHHFTGSKFHNIKLREMANAKGLTISEYGVHRLDTNELVVSGRSEEDIYSILGLPWIPPELREDKGEIAAAARNALPKLVEEQDIQGDLHVHTRWSDGRNTIEQMVEAAQMCGYRYMAICDHTHHLKIAHGLSEHELRKQMAEISRLNENLRDFRILMGSEVDIRRDGTLDISHGLLRQLDIVVASIHQRFNLDREQMTRRIVRAIETGLIDILAHPTGRLINQRDPYDVDLERVFQAAAAYSVALEINSYPDRLDLNDTYARLAKEKGIKLVINTDAHNTGELANIRYGLAMARRGWLKSSDIINTWNLEDLLAWLQYRRAHPTSPT
ncbi:MAG: DNA polymerase/3'-5' exonuclease PolX, partial [Armatimonadota bacterium]